MLSHRMGCLAANPGREYTDAAREVAGDAYAHSHQWDVGMSPQQLSSLSSMIGSVTMFDLEAEHSRIPPSRAEGRAWR